MPGGAQTVVAAGVATARLTWPDTVKGLAILWIVYFHTFKEFAAGRFVGPFEVGFWPLVCPPGDSIGVLLWGAWRALFIAFSFLGYHAVGVFIALSGFALSFSLARKGSATVDWPAWYRSRVLRLFPLYWVAHVIYVVSPPQVRPDPIDYRFLLSILGDRVYPLPDMSYYANPAWWFFGLLLQLYLVFPVLHRWRERLGAAWFLAASAAVTLGSRYLLLFPLASEHSGALLGGTLFTCRLFEFTAGMALGAAYARDEGRTARHLLSAPAAVAAAALFVGGLFAGTSLLAYTVADGLIGCGLTVLLTHVAVAMQRLSIHAPVTAVGVYSYGLYLLHQPYVIWLGVSLQGATLSWFVACALASMIVLALASSVIERWVNAIVARVMG